MKRTLVDRALKGRVEEPDCAERAVTTVLIG